jgi:hypothetical protein
VRIRLLALGLVWVASLSGQHHHFNWQNYCFDHPRSLACDGHEYAVKGAPKGPGAKNSVRSPISSIATGTSSVVVVGAGAAFGAQQWRFADPSSNALAGFNVSALSASPLAHDMIAQLGANQGITEADMKKIFDGLSGVDQVALSARDNGALLLVTRRSADSTLPALDAGFKVVPVSGNAMLAGNSDAVDRAVQRIAVKAEPPELTRLAEGQQSSEFWAVGPAELIGPEAVNAGVKRFSLALSIGDHLSGDLTFEFDKPPSEDTLKTWQTPSSEATLEGNAVHIRMSMEADEAKQKFGAIAATPLGQRLAELVKSARYLPVPDPNAPKPFKPMIFGLDGGPREVNQLSR